MRMMSKKALFPLLFLLLAGVAIYTVRTDFQWIKSLFNYNVPPLVTPSFSPLPQGSPVAGFAVPEGLSMSVVAQGLTNPRVIAFDPQGRMLVSETKAGRVILLKDADKDGVMEERVAVLGNLKSPHGIAFYTDAKKATYLYVAEEHQVARYPYDPATGKVTDIRGTNIVTLPKETGRHFTRTIGFGPNLRKNAIVEGMNLQGFLSKDKLYVTVGSSCDVCVEDSWKYAAMLESDPSGSYTAEFASGLRNTVFFAFHPVTGKIWGTDMGRDNLGDNLPPDEINIIESQQNYGWPFCYGKQVKDAKFNPGTVTRTDIPQDCAKTFGSHIDIPAHSAPLGLAFIADKRWPAAWQNHLLVAYHGSWNRSTPTGYKIVKFELDKDGKPLKGQADDFITGWMQGKNIVGRPADLKFGPDGALYVSDDAAGLIYRVAPK